MTKQWLMLGIGRLFVTVKSTTNGLNTEVNTDFTVEILKHFLQMGGGGGESNCSCVVQFIH